MSNDDVVLILDELKRLEQRLIEMEKKIEQIRVQTNKIKSELDQR